MALRTGEAEWNGTIREGTGRLRLGSGAFEGAYSYRSRMEDGPGTNPEELIAAAHAGCFSMALSAGLSRAGYEPRRIRTDARVRFEPVEGGFAITRIDLETEAEVPGIDEESFREQAETAKANCPVSKALASVGIGLEARLV